MVSASSRDLTGLSSSRRPTRTMLAHSTSLNWRDDLRRSGGFHHGCSGTASARVPRRTPFCSHSIRDAAPLVVPSPYHLHHPAPVALGRRRFTDVSAKPCLLCAKARQRLEMRQRGSREVLPKAGRVERYARRSRTRAKTGATIRRILPRTRRGALDRPGAHCIQHLLQQKPRGSETLKRQRGTRCPSVTPDVRRTPSIQLASSSAVSA
jgi:hypothetical protein